MRRELRNDQQRRDEEGITLSKKIVHIGTSLKQERNKRRK
jgi:hypothetical protein